MERARPTLRCLLDDLHLPLPSADEPLDEIDHPLQAKATEQFAVDDAPRERIRAIDDHIFFKVKVQRWRGAVWPSDRLPWLVAAGRREAGSGADFYAVLVGTGKAARARHNRQHGGVLTTDTWTAHLLPDRDDHLRHQIEAGVRFVRHLETLIPRLVRASLCDGKEHAADLDGFGLGVQVRADEGYETYVAVRITGSVPDNVILVVLDIVPGCDRKGWYPEATLPDRLLGPNEQAWSNIMDTAAAAQLLGSEG
jgi:hypothetical protein